MQILTNEEIYIGIDSIHFLPYLSYKQKYCVRVLGAERLTCICGVMWRDSYAAQDCGVFSWSQEAMLAMLDF